MKKMLIFGMFLLTFVSAGINLNLEEIETTYSGETVTKNLTIITNKDLLVDLSYNASEGIKVFFPENPIQVNGEKIIPISILFNKYLGSGDYNLTINAKASYEEDTGGGGGGGDDDDYYQKPEEKKLPTETYRIICIGNAVWEYKNKSWTEKEICEDGCEDGKCKEVSLVVPLEEENLNPTRLQIIMLVIGIMVIIILCIYLKRKYEKNNKY